ncbi:MAG: glycosyltransferase family 1 protein [Candidatus Kapabacteria bacterium]|nr:glycosyltransferase family 1 protein [Candidatus Kapabacteria bacterium]
MRPISTFVVAPSIPEPLTPLVELSRNFWWCWDNEATRLWSHISPTLWEQTHHNPVALLQTVSAERLTELATDADFIQRCTAVVSRFRDYMTSETWFTDHTQELPPCIAYFCAEFGLHESFQMYSGGLGVLAGDHLKSASDLGLPLLGIGLLYQEGYFRQYLTESGWQNEHYAEMDFRSLPIQRMNNHDGSPVTISVDFPTGTCHAYIWRAMVGRVPLYLLDTNVPANTDPILRDVTDRLYGGSVDTRIMQELMLGIGGMRALKALGIQPDVCHINEGHAAFFLLERTHQFMERFSMTFQEAWNLTRSSTAFTTHTPVPAGNEVFPIAELEPYLRRTVEGIGLAWSDFTALGASIEDQPTHEFSMTVFGLKGSTFRNGVSALHGQVARQMWKSVWKDFPVDEVPIGGIVNGVHTPTWVAPELGHVYDAAMGTDWRTRPWDAEVWKGAYMIPDESLWRAHEMRRHRLVHGARRHVMQKHHAALSERQSDIIDEMLRPDVLTVGFARRFATYKRADLLMSNMERLASIATHAGRPLQFILAGKAHPKDLMGKELIQEVHRRVRAHGLERSFVFLEDYDMDIARLLVRGCDIWLNTPRRPYEASGTSGMKAAINGVLHCSVLDGWWAEGYDGHNGWAIGRGEEANEHEQDVSDAAALYDLLEFEIAPMFYDRDAAGVPHRWIERMKHNIATNAWRFSSHRMVGDYARQAYAALYAGQQAMLRDNAQGARELLRFEQQIARLWPSVRIVSYNVKGHHPVHVGERLTAAVRVHLGDISPDQVRVELVHGPIDSRNEIRPQSTVHMNLVGQEDGDPIFEGTSTCLTSGIQGCTVRIVPHNEAYATPAEARRATYAHPT